MVSLARRVSSLPDSLPSGPEKWSSYQAGEAALLADDLPTAARIFTALVATAPAFAPGLIGLAHVLFYENEPVRALAYTNRAFRADPRYIPVYEMYTVLLHHLDYHAQVVHWAEQGLAVEPTAVNLLNNLALAHYVLENYPAALAAFQRLLVVQPENANAAHLVEALSGANPARASAAFVGQHFDAFHHFDKQLTTFLHYQVPAKLAGLLAEAMPAPVTPAWAVVDLGCGTGLAGQALAPWAQTLTGVDLSARLLTTAATRGYTQLSHGDILTWLPAAPAESADLVVAADVLIYLGDLAPVFAGISRLLRAGGFFLCSTEDLEADNPAGSGFFLKKSSRYGHSPAYLMALAARYGLALRQQQPAALREDRNQPVPGLLWLFEKIAPHPLG